MTIEEIRARIEEIISLAGDDETQHSREDRLYLDFIRYVASLGDRVPPLAEQAAEILRTQELDFCRWYA